jgi:hypothetical protein
MQKKTIFIFILTFTLLSCKKTPSNYWHNKLEGKQWQTANQHAPLLTEEDELYFDLKLGCGNFKLIKKYRTDAIGSDSMSAGKNIYQSHWEYIKGNYLIDENTSSIIFNGIYTKRDFLTKADTCFYPDGIYKKIISLSDYKNGVNFDFPKDVSSQNVHGYLINTGTVDCTKF